MCFVRESGSGITFPTLPPKDFDILLKRPMAIATKCPGRKGGEKFIMFEEINK